jgi:hypothetical protein
LVTPLSGHDNFFERGLRLGHADGCHQRSDGRSRAKNRYDVGTDFLLVGLSRDNFHFCDTLFHWPGTAS